MAPDTKKAHPAPTDPPVEPFPDSTRSYESGPAPILDGEALATLIVRVGMATNAVNAQSNAARAAFAHAYSAAKHRDTIMSLVTAAAFTNEAVKLAQENMSTLRELASSVGAQPELLKKVGQLASGNHPASELLKRARNKLGFHWDHDVVLEAVRDFGKNKKITWVEFKGKSEPVHRLATEVQSFALLSSSDRSTDDAVRRAIERLADAMDQISEFFTAAVVGYMKRVGVERKQPAEPIVDRQGRA